MSQIINRFEELMTAKKIKRARIFISNGPCGVKVWYNNTSRIYIFDDFVETEVFIKELEDLGVECIRLKRKEVKK